MDNITIARLLDETAALLEIDNADPFRVRSYRRAATAATSTTTNAGKATALAADRSRPVQWTRLRFPSLYSVKGHFRPRRTAEELCRLVDWLSGSSGILHQPA